MCPSPNQPKWPWSPVPAEDAQFHLAPVRVFLVEDIDGKWNFLGQALIIEQTIDAERDETRGVFEIIKLYPRSYARLMNELDAPDGKGLVSDGDIR